MRRMRPITDAVLGALGDTLLLVTLLVSAAAVTWVVWVVWSLLQEREESPQ